MAVNAVAISHSECEYATAATHPTKATTPIATKNRPGQKYVSIIDPPVCWQWVREWSVGSICVSPIANPS